MLVVVHHRDVALLFEPALDLKTLGRLDVFKIDSAKGGGNGFNSLDKLFGIFFGHFDVETVKAGKNLEEERLALHYRLSGFGTYVAKPEHCGAVADHGHQIALVGVFVNVVGIFLDLLAGIGHAGGVGQREIVLGGVGYCGYYLNFAGLPLAMIFEGSFARNGC